MAKVKSYMNPNIPKPKPRTSGEEKYERSPRITNPIIKPVEPRKKRRTPPGITGPEKREKRPLPKPINKSGLRKDGPSGKKGSISMSVKKPVLLSRKKTAGR